MSNELPLQFTKKPQERKPKKEVKKKPTNLLINTQPKKDFDITKSGTFSHPDLFNIQIGTEGIKEKSETPSTETPFSSSKIEYSDLKIQKTEIGRGASASVFKVKYQPKDSKNSLELKPNMKYALKKVNLFQTNSAKLIMQEIKHLYKSINCPHVVKFYEAFHREGSIQILLEFMDMGSLDDIIKLTEKIPENVLCEMSFQILKGLEFLEEKKIIHRDIKPSNILLNESGETKISDFGLSKETEDNFTGTFTGTQIYMSPERLTDNKYSYPSDIWSLGISLIECFTGKLPFEGKSLEVFEFTNELKNFKPKVENASKEFQEFLEKCLNPDPGKRLGAKDLLSTSWIEKNLKNSLERTETIKFLKDVYLKKKKEKELKDSRPRGSSNSGIVVHKSNLKDFDPDSLLN